MTSHSESARNVIRVNATSIDVTSSDAITFGFVNELARAGRVIGGRHRLRSPVPAAAGGKKHVCNTASSLWHADSLHFGGSVLVELLDPAIAEDPGLAEVFQAEVRAAAAVSSPFVNRVLDFGVECSTPYLVSELSAGDTLATRIAARQRPATSEFVRLFAELARAVDAMHAVGLLHRDLRSERVQLFSLASSPPFSPACLHQGPQRCPPLHPAPSSELSHEPSSSSARRVEEHVKVSFGISKLMNDTLDLVRTMARRACAPAATPLYASPEQVLGTEPLSPESDLWSLAVIAFEWLTGELPFSGATTAERLVQVCAGNANVPSQVADVPLGFDDWFERGVRRDARQRWSSGAEMAEALASLGCGGAARSNPADAPPSAG